MGSVITQKDTKTPNGRMAEWQNAGSKAMKSNGRKCLLRFVGMPSACRGDALHYRREGISTKQRRHRNEAWKALERVKENYFTILTKIFVKIFGGFKNYSYLCSAFEMHCE